MKCLILTLQLFVSSAIFAFDYKDYSQLVNKAELAITDNQFELALTCYNTAFKMKEKPFVQDVYNASICAVKDKQNKMAMAYCNMLAQAGVGGKFLTGNSIYRPLSREKGWADLVRLADKIRNQFLTRNKKLLHILDSMAAKDQSVNQEWSAAGNGMETPERERMDLTYDTLANDLYRILDSTGFVSEQMIGAVIKNDTALSYMLPYDIIIIHNYQSRRRGDTLFRPMLYKAVSEGLIKPDYLAFIEDFGSNMTDRPSYGTARNFILYKCTIYIDKYAKERFPAINANRAAIGLGTIADDLKKIRYKISHPENIFFLRANYSRFGSFANKDSEQRFLASNEIVVQRLPGCQ